MNTANLETATLRVENLKVHFPIRHGVLGRARGAVHAVDGVSLEVAAHETVGLVGESGCGKTTTGRAIVGLERPTAGRVLLDDLDISAMDERRLRPHRRRLQMVFQDPYGSLDPRMTVGNIIAEPLRRHRPDEDIERLVFQYMDLTGLPRQFARRYPHEFSGGQRQRIGIARAIAPQPDVIIADEPVSALDVSIQAQILNLMKDLQEELGVAYLFIAHDLSVVKHISHRVAVMYLGRIMETAPAEELYRAPRHPYTRALLQSVPVADPDRARNRSAVRGETPSPLEYHRGCPFADRCPHATDICRTEMPPSETVAQEKVPPTPTAHETVTHGNAVPRFTLSRHPGSMHTVWCHHWKEIA